MDGGAALTTSQRSLRIGVIGAGFGAAVHVPGFLSEGWEVPVLWGRRTELAREKATALGVSDVAEDWRKIVARDDLDAVAVTTPPAVHYQIVAAALRAGKHVLCEKPFALNLNEARGMRDLAEEHERTAMIAHETRFAPQRAQIKDLLDEGRVGTPELVSAELLLGRLPPDSPPPYTWAADTRQGGGLLGALGSHYIDGFRHWFGEVAEVSGRLMTRNPNRLDADGQLVQADADDGFSFTLRFRSGVVASMTASSQIAPSLGARITIAGSDGVLVATQRGANPEPDGVVLAGRPEDRGLEELPVDPRYVPIEDDRDHRLPAFRLLVREFGRGIREGRSPAPNFDDGVACQQILDAVRLAAASGQTVFPDGTPIGGRGDPNVALIPGGGGANRFRSVRGERAAGDDRGPGGGAASRRRTDHQRSPAAGAGEIDRRLGGRRPQPARDRRRRRRGRAARRRGGERRRRYRADGGCEARDRGGGLGRAGPPDRGDRHRPTS